MVHPRCPGSGGGPALGISFNRIGAQWRSVCSSMLNQRGLSRRQPTRSSGVAQGARRQMWHRHDELLLRTRVRAGDAPGVRWLGQKEVI
ncbi:MAG: hypothetical protein M3468_09270 [Acidobacteriota bacterium]|nr:hypothetical protein [Acidobacteriota bacterium]